MYVYKVNMRQIVDTWTPKRHSYIHISYMFISIYLYIYTSTYMYISLYIYT